MSDSTIISSSDSAFVQKVEQCILTELSHGRYKIAKALPNIMSPIGAIIKGNGDVRLIHDCSRPAGSCVNDYAPYDPLKYQSLQYAFEFITPQCWLTKVDLAHAYRSVHIHPSNTCATGLAWRFNKGDNQDMIMVDERLSFGACRSPFIFHKLSQAVVAIMRRLGFPQIIAYLDDFLIVHQDYELCLAAMNTLLRLPRALGFAISYPKVEGPRNITFLGIAQDTIKMTCSLPRDKLAELRALVNDAAVRKTVDKRYLQVLAGKLCFASRVYYGGQSFLRRVINVMNKLKRPGHRVHITAQLRADLAWWQAVLPRLDGTTPIIDKRDTVPVAVNTDRMGCWTTAPGGVVRARWEELEGSERLGPIYKEVLALMPAMDRWANH
jgi:hypothetical protein